MTDATQLDTLTENWGGLLRGARGRCLQFQEFALVHHWLSHFGSSPDADTIKPAILLGYKHSQLVMVWPMVRQRRLGLTLLQWLGDPVTQYGDVAAFECGETEQWIRKGFDFLRANGGADVLVFDRLRTDGALAPVLRDIGFTPTHTETALAVDLGAFSTMEGFRKRFSGKTRRLRRRARALLQENGEVSFDVYGACDRALLAVEKAFAFKMEWLTQRGQVSRAFLNSRFQDYWIGLVTGPTAGEDVLVSELRCGSETIAVEIGLVTKGHYIAHIGAFNPRFEKFGPGALQMEETIAYLQARGMHTYDLLPPDDGYKRRWADTEVGIEDYIIASSAFGHAYMTLGLHSLKDSLKNHYGQLPLGVRRSIAWLLPEIVGKK